jgi:hypothetical protein
MCTNITVQFRFETGKMPLKRILWLAALAKREEGGSDFRAKREGGGARPLGKKQKRHPTSPSFLRAQRAIN